MIHARYELDFDSLETNPFEPKYIVHKGGIEIRKVNR